MIDITNKSIAFGIIIICHCTLISFVTSQTYVTVSESACFSSADRTIATIFSAPFEGVVDAVELEYVSGPGVTCSTSQAKTNWGCLYPHPDGAIQVTLQRTSNGNAWGSLEYPKLNEPGASFPGIFSNCPDCSILSWTSASYNHSSPNLVMLGQMTVDSGDTFSLQTCEAACPISFGDNEGTTCAKVIFIYSSFITKNPTSEPTIPTFEPTAVPTAVPTLPTNEPTNAPSDSPSDAPSDAPSLSPSQSPTRNPSPSPSEYPSNEPSNQPSMKSSTKPTSAPTTESGFEIGNFQMMIFTGFIMILLCVGFVIICICYKKISNKQTINYNHQIPQIRVVNNGQNSFVVHKPMVNDHHVSMQDY